MKTVIFAAALIAFAQCAKLDHLKYLPPDNRPANKESYDQGLAAPTTQRAYGSVGSGPQSRSDDSFELSSSVEPQSIAPGSFDAGSQNAARLQGSPFIPHGSQTSGTFRSSVPASQPNQAFSTGQQALNEPQSTNKPSAPISSTFGSINAGPQSGAEPQKFNQPQGFFGSSERKPSYNGIQSAGPQSTSTFQGPSAFGNTQAGVGPQPTSQPQGSYGTQNSQPTISTDVHTAGPQSTGNFQGSPTFGNTIQNSQAGSGPQQTSQPQGSYGTQNSQPSISADVHTAGPQSTGNFQGAPTFGNTIQTSQTGSGPQQTSQPQGSYGTQTSQPSISTGAQSAGPYGSSQPQGSNSGQSGQSSTFPGTTGSGASISHGSSFANNVPVVSNFKSQGTSGTFGTDSQPSGSFESSTTVGKNVSPIESQPRGFQQSQTFGGIGGQQQQQQGPQSTGTSRSFDTTYSNQAPGSFGPGKSTGSFNDGNSISAQPKYQPSTLNQIPIIRLDTKNYGDGSYSTAYETGNGIQAEEQGQTQGDSSIAQGSYSYTSPEGEKVGVSYTADEDGYHPQGEHLPTPPPIPEAILKSIEYNRAHPEEENDDGSYNEPESSGPFKSTFGKTQFSGSSNKYLAPTSSSEPRSQFSGGSLNPSSSTRGSSALQSTVPASNQASFSSSNYPSPTGSNESQEKSGSPISAPTASNYGPYSSQPGSNKQSAASDSQPKESTSFGTVSTGPSISSSRAFPSSSFGNFAGSKPFQGAVNQPIQNSGPSSQSFNSPSSFPSGSKSGSFNGRDSSAPHGSSFGQFNSQPSPVVQSSSPAETNTNKGTYGSSGTGFLNPNVPQKAQSGQFSFQNTASSPTNQQSGSTLSTSYPSQSNYGNTNNGPVKAFGTPQQSGNARFGGSAPTDNKSTFGQFSGSSAPQQQSSQASYASGPSATKSTQFSGYQYNAPNAFRTSGPSNFQQGGSSEPKAFTSGNTQGPEGQSNNKFGSESGPSKIVGEFGPGISRSHPGPVRTPGVQAQDENGGYLY